MQLERMHMCRRRQHVKIISSHENCPIQRSMHAHDTHAALHGMESMHRDVGEFCRGRRYSQASVLTAAGKFHINMLTNQSFTQDLMPCILANRRAFSVLQVHGPAAAAAAAAPFVLTCAQPLPRRQPGHAFDVS